MNTKKLVITKDTDVKKKNENKQKKKKSKSDSVNSKILLKNEKIEVKIISSDDEEDKKIKICPPNLLLSYLYHLNTEHTKYITSGFNAKTLTPYVIVTDVSNGFIELNEMEYNSIFLKSDNINGYFNTYADRDSYNQIVFDPELLLQCIDIKFNLINGVKHIIVQRCGNIMDIHRVTLNENEWITLKDLFGFFNHLLFWYKNISQAVTAYYNHYLKMCSDNNQICLGHHEFFTLNDINNNNPYLLQQNFNCFRLFHEIGLLCTENITIKILKKIYSSK